LDGNEWDAELAAIVKKAWTTMDGDGRNYTIEMIKNAQEHNKAYITSVSGLKQTLVKAMSLPYHTEAKFCENGLVKIYEDDTILVTCTTSYSASKKYYGDTHWCTASDIAGRYDGFQKFVEYTTDENACLVQFVPKADRTKAIQAQFYDDGWSESICDFYDKTKEVEDIVALFDNEKTGHDVIKYKIPYSDLCRETEKAVDNESDYWNSKSKSFFEKQKKAFSDEIANGGYDSLLINAIIEYEGKKAPPSDKFVFTDGNDRWEMSTYEVVGYFDGYAVFNTELMGLSDAQKAFIGRLFDDSDEAAEEYTNYIFTISTEGGKVTKSSRVLSRFKGTAYSNLIINGIAEIKYYSYRYDADYRRLVNLKNGKTILNEVFQAFFYDGKVFFQKNYEEYEDSVWHVLDTATGKYLGKSSGYLENVRKEFSSGKIMSESKSLISELDENNVMEIRTNDIKKMVSECLSLILEKNTPVLYHFLCADSLIHLLKTNRFDLNDCGDGTYYMSTTRNRNSVQGYPYMQSDYSMGGGTYHNPGNEGMLIRLELDGELLSAYGKIQPYDYLYDTGDACDINLGPLNGIQDAMTYKDCPEEMYHQPFSQGEDRLVSRKKSIPNANRIIRKIDMYIDPYKAGDKHWQDVYGKKLTYLIKNYKDKINFYDDRNKFDRQI
jgi:hypothetical protein